MDTDNFCKACVFWFCIIDYNMKKFRPYWGG